MEDWSVYMLIMLLVRFYPRAVVSAVNTTATWLAAWVFVFHSRYYIKTTKPILKLCRQSGSPIIVCLLAWGLTALSAQIGYIAP